LLHERIPAVGKINYSPEKILMDKSLILRHKSSI